MSNNSNIKLSNSFSIDSNDDYFLPKDILVARLNTVQLQEIINVFEARNRELTRDEFIETIDLIFGNHQHSVEAAHLFKKLDASNNNNNKITKKQFVDYLIENLNLPKWREDIKLIFRHRFSPPHVKKEPIQKIIPIQTNDYFCYGVVTKYGGVGLYDVNLCFLSYYRGLFTKNELNIESKGRKIKRNRWVTDSVYFPNVSILAISNSTRTITFYDATRLKHYLIWMIFGFPNIIQSMRYCCDNNEEYSILLLGDDHGQIYLLKFINISEGLLPKKFTDKPNVLIWQDILEEKKYVNVIKLTESHGEEIKRMFYCVKNSSVASCSRDCKKSVIIQHITGKLKPYIFKMKKGANCFVLLREKRIMITGDVDGTIAVWNIFVTNKPSTILKNEAPILDLAFINIFNMFLSYSQKGILTLWDLKTERVVQSLTIKFPEDRRWSQALTIFDVNLLYVYEKNNFGHIKDQCTDIISIGSNKKMERHFHQEYEMEKSKMTESKWDVSNIFVINSNYVANVLVKYSEKNDLISLVLRPPPLHNSVLIPFDWKIRSVEFESDKSSSEERNVGETYSNESIDNISEQLSDDETDKGEDAFQKAVGNHSFFSFKEPFDINWKISLLENEKFKESCFSSNPSAVFLRLKLQETSDIKISPDLLKSDNKTVRKTFEKASNQLDKANYRNKVFYEDSSSSKLYSSRSSTSSLYDLLL